MLARLGRLSIVLFVTALATAWAQQNCPLPPALQAVSAQENIFSDQQEVALGDAMAEVIALHVNIIQNDELSAHLRELGNRLIEHLPPSHLSFRFYLIDLPQVNAFSIAGGRVYVSRKIVAFARSDDEIAGILAHELGHIVTHQSAIEMTRSFREVLGVTQVGDRADVFRKFHDYVENVSRLRTRRKRAEEEKRQIAADQVSIFALARAGFNVQAFPEFWDRFTELHGKTGSWFSDLFGTTTPEQHRLRDMIKNAGTLPARCTDQRPTMDEGSFSAWQDAVVDFDSATRTEALPGLILKRKLSARLRSEISNLRFSPDGRYILAQDDGGINVVTREPFAFVFYIPAADAEDAQFSPDSQSIVFMTSGMRAALWSIAEQSRKSVREITLREPCLQSELSPNGDVLACLTSQLTLELVDVANSSIIYQQKDFYHPDFFEALTLLLTVMREATAPDSGASAAAPKLIKMAFCPDGRYFLAAHGTVHLFFDLVKRTKAPIPSSIQSAVGINFAFLAPDRIIGVNTKSPAKSHILKFPTGETVGDVQLWPNAHLRGATHGDFAFVGPLKEYPLGIMDLTTHENKVVLKQNAADMYDGVFVTERVNGELALHTTDGQLVARVNLPESALGRVHAGAVSADLNYLAVSTRTRGAIWDIARDARVFHTRRFNAVSLDGPAAYADFPKFEETPREIGELRADSGRTAETELKDEFAILSGTYLVVTKGHGKDGTALSNADLEVRDVRSNRVLWSHYFPKDVPAISMHTGDGTMLMRWAASSAGGHEEIEHYPDLKSASRDDYICNVFDAKSGASLSHFVVKTNGRSVRYWRGTASHGWAVMEATGDQIITYALATGEEKGQFFGSRPVLSSSGLLAVESDKREITLYDLGNSEARQQYTFAQPIALKAFSGDSQRLLVFTADQTVYLLDVANSSKQQPSLAVNPVN